jgi:eukaryotic-like serine/threonine-protein kinase
MICPNCLTDNPDATQVCISCGSFVAVTGSSTSFFHLPAGTTLKQGQYQIETLLGEGGFGITYKGTYLANGAPVAIKELWPEKGSRQNNKIMWPSSITPQQRFQQLSKFKLEASHQQKCDHPNIAKVYDWFDENETCYIVMEFISGKSLFRIFQEEGILHEDRVKKYFISITESLKIVHQNNFLHRDIKPDNIIIDLQDRAVLIDFGAAREFISGQTGEMTRMLTPGYAPYEQYSQNSKRFPATDFYALFASIYEVLTGVLPAEATDRASALLTGVAADPLISPKKLNPKISDLMERAILIGMRVRVEERFQTADEALEALNGKLVSPLHRKAQEFVKQGQLLDAAQAYQKCLNGEPNNAEAAIELALVEIYLDDDRAEIAAQNAISLKPNDARGHGVLGLVYCHKNNWQLATQHLQQAAQLSPSSAWIHTNLSWALGKIGNWQLAESIISIALNLNNNCAFALGLQAWITFNQQQYKSAIRSATQAITRTKQAPSFASTQIQYWVYPYLITALDRVSINQQSVDLDRRIDDCLNQIPNHSFVWGLKGLNAAQKSDWNSAVFSFQQAIQISFVPSWVFLNAAATYEHIGDRPVAIQIYQKQIQQSAGDFYTYYRLGTLFAQQMQWEDAKTFLEYAIQLQPDYPQLYHNLGWVLLNLKNSSGQIQNSRELLSTYRKAIALYTQQNQLYYVKFIQEAFKLADIDI